MYGQRLMINIHQYPQFLTLHQSLHRSTPLSKVPKPQEVQRYQRVLGKWHQRQSIPLNSHREESRLRIHTVAALPKLEVVSNPEERRYLAQSSLAQSYQVQSDQAQSDQAQSDQAQSDQAQSHQYQLPFHYMFPPDLVWVSTDPLG
jgi:hypothetical protein